jgi:tetratricopeptide (TPR) repeat protein
MVMVMRSIHDWLPDLRQHQNDYTWLAYHFDDLIEAITYGAQIPHLVVEAVEALDCLSQYALTRSDYTRLKPILFDALMHLQELGDHTLQSQIWAQIGDNLLLYGLQESARGAFANAAFHDDSPTSPDVRLRVHIGLIKTQALQYRVDAEFVHNTLEIARHVHNPSLIPVLYHTLCMAYLYVGETELALGYGQTAYAWWHQHHNHTEKVNAAFALAEACRKAGLLAQARRFLQLAARQLEQTHHQQESALYAYQTGVTYLHGDEYHTAEAWLRVALGRYEKLDYPAFTSAAHHALGLALMHQGYFDQAQAHYRSALGGWQKLGNGLEKANLFHAFGYMRFLEKDYRRALGWFRHALQHCNRVPPSRAQQQLKAIIEASIEDVLPRQENHTGSS